LAVDLPDAAPAGVEPEPDVELRVVHADAAVVVVDKPAGVVVHPGAGHAHGTLVAGLLARFPDLAGVGDPERPGIVHRLDRGTSGLLVVARTAAAYQSLTAQLAERTVGRRYVALVTGHVADDRGVVDAPIGRSSRTPTKMAVSANGRPARTAYRVLRRLAGQPALDQPSTLLALALETGRTHQIRVHLAAIGHPVVGDDRYGPPGRVGGRALPAGRLFLHAAQLGFDHPGSGERVVWTSPLPDDLAGLTGPVDVDDL
ncbi:MAG TPA: RluA family pseudouridine synthase, partial [Acidimicrobiales bacterium]